MSLFMSIDYNSKAGSYLHSSNIFRFDQFTRAYKGFSGLFNLGLTLFGQGYICHARMLAPQ